MNGLDAKFLYSETRTAHMHTIKVVILDVSEMGERYSYDRLLGVLESQLDRLPLFRRRIVTVPLGLGHPVWVEDPDFDLKNHVNRAVVAAPGDQRELAALVGGFASTALDRSRPLWDLLVVEGLEDDRVALVIKLHHAVADGSAAVALLENVVRGTSQADPSTDASTTWRPEPIPGRRALLALAARAHIQRWKGLPHLVVRSIEGARSAGTLRRQQPVKAPLPLHHIPKASFNASLSPGRTFAMTVLPMSPLREIRHASQTTFNDVYLAVCAGALRRYMEARGEVPDQPLVASVPVSTDPNMARLTGNRVDNLYVSIGTDIVEPMARLQRIHEVTMASKEVRGLLGHDLLEQRADVAPPQLYSSIVRLWSRSHIADVLHPPLNVILSNVAGPKDRIFFGPVEIDALYSVGPILEGIGLNITAWSYGSDLGISVLGCPVTVADPWEIIDALHDSFNELLGAVRDGEVASRS
jgi:WS/DGAT/MGAT family acyltransferase